MNIYELITQNSKLVGTFINCGLISTSVANNYEVYQYYKDRRAIGEIKTHAVQFTAIHYNMSDRHVFNILRAMEEEVSYR